MKSILHCVIASTLVSALLGAAPPPVESLRAAPDGFDLRLAQANMARAAAAGLPAMEKAAGAQDPKLPGRLRETVGLMLIVSTPWENVRKCPGLLALCNNQFDQARNVAKIFAGAATYDSGARGMAPPATQPPTPSPAQVAQRQLRDALGYAIPAVVELAQDPSPPARMYAMQLLLVMGATGQKPTLDTLLKDSARVRVSHGDYMTNEAIGESLAQTLRLQHPFVGTTPEHAAAYEAEPYVQYLDRLARGDKASPDYELTNRIRKEGNAYDAPSWDEYWKRAAPILKQVWNTPAK